MVRRIAWVPSRGSLRVTLMFVIRSGEYQNSACQFQRVVVADGAGQDGGRLARAGEVHAVGVLWAEALAYEDLLSLVEGAGRRRREGKIGMIAAGRALLCRQDALGPCAGDGVKNIERVQGLLRVAVQRTEVMAFAVEPAL